MMARRALLGAAGALAAAGAARADPGVPAGQRLTFNVMRKGSIIGTHMLAFHQSGADLEVRIDVQLSVGIGPIKFFRYTLTGVERHSGGKFVSLQTTTNDNGTARKVTARHTDAGVMIESLDIGTFTLPADARPLNHWDSAALSGPLFNPQDGKLMKLTVTPRGPGNVMLSNGAKITATWYALSGEADIEDCYDQSNVWAGLRATAPDGSVLDYQRSA